jgi:D-arginine dehydrogenase
VEALSFGFPFHVDPEHNLPMTERKHIVVVGGGIAGLSLASELAHDNEVTILEAEMQPGYHSTGRSAAVFVIPFVNDVVHRLSVASERFFVEPPKGFDRLSQRLTNVLVAEADNADQVTTFLDTWSRRCPWLKRVTGVEIRDEVPILKKEIVCGARDERSLALDVHNILEGHRRRLLERNGFIETRARVVEMSWQADRWRVELDNGKVLFGDMLINAAGAWATEVAELAGAVQVSLQPKRRTGIIVDTGVDSTSWPMIHVASGDLYFKPEASMLMVSPADETDSTPCDAQPDEWDVAVGMDRLNQLVTIDIDRPERTWAGLRSFVPDRAPVIGFDPQAPSFFWLAAFGGFGVQTSPTYSRMASGLINDESLPDDLEALRELVAPDRPNLDRG